jgi:membrane protease YdiL (CAAX protease family)
MQKYLTIKNLSRFSLLFLIVGRFLISIPVYRSGSVAMSYWGEVTFLCIAYSLISFLLWANKSSLYKMNIDKNFIIIFIVLGYLYSFLIPLAFGILLGTATTLTVGVFFSSESKYTKNEFGYSSFFLSLIILLILDFIYFIIIQKAKLFMGSMSVVDVIFLVNPPFLLAEEFVFRGLLWGFLRDLKFSENKIIYIQAFLFWLCHFYFAPIVLWILFPLISILLGYLASRTKSITLSLFLHFLHNFLGFVFRF